MQLDSLYSTLKHQTIHFLLLIRLGVVHPGEIDSISQGLTCRDKHPFTLTFTPTGNLEKPIKLTLHVFGLREEAGVRAKTHQHYALRPSAPAFCTVPLGNSSLSEAVTGTLALRYGHKYLMIKIILRKVKWEDMKHRY